MESNKILVIGDSNVDEFVYCHVDRLCPEGPVPVLDVIEEERNYGMAGNVHRNIVSFGVDAELITNPNKDSIKKTRYVEKKTNHLFLRIDAGPKIERTKSLYSIDFKKYSAIIISDYNKGFLEKEDIEYITTKNPLTFLDTKKELGEWCKWVRFIKINEKEYNLSKHQIEKCGLQEKIIQTCGEKGCYFNGVNYPVTAVEVKDLAGAGDSFLAALVVEYLKSFDIPKSIIEANKAATIVVQKRGVSLVND